MVNTMSIRSVFYQFTYLTSLLAGRDTATYYILKAAEQGDLSALKACMAANIHHSPFYSATRPLILAAQNGHTTIIEYLYQYHNYQQETAVVWRAIGLAAQHGHTDVLTFLLGKLDLSKPQTYLTAWKRAIYLAIQEKNIDSALTLLRARPNVKPAELSVLFPVTLRSGLTPILDHLIELGVPHKPRTPSIPLTFYAVASGNPEIVERWLQQDSSPEQADPNGSTTLMLGAYLGYDAIVKSLTQKVTDQKISRADSALSLATSAGHKDIAQHLTQQGVEPKATNATCFLLNPKRYDLRTIKEVEQTSDDIIRFNRHFNERTCAL